VSFTYLKVKSAKCICLLPVVLVFVISVLVLVLRIWSCLHHCHTPYSWWGLLPLPKNPIPLSAFGLHFRLFGPHSAASSNSLHSPPPMHRGLDKTLVVPIFGAKECVIMQHFVLKIYKNSGGPDPRGGKRDILFAPTPVPTCQMLVTLRFF